MRSSGVLAVAVGTVFATGGCGDSKDEQASSDAGSSKEAVTAPQPARGKSVQASFAITERPRGPQDLLPKYAEMSFSGGGMGGYSVDTDESRFAGRRADAKYWVIPGDRDLCLSTANGAGGCASRKQAAEGFLFGQQIGPPLLAEDEVRSYGLLPDGPDEVTATFEDGPERRVSVKNNLWVVRSRKGLDSVEWKSAASSGRIRIPG